MFFSKKPPQPNIIKKGVTLVEVSVALALIAIVSTMVVSFCALTIANVKVYKTYDNLRNEYALIDTLVSEWVSDFDSDEYSLSVNSDNSVLSATKDGTSFTLFFNDSKIEAKFSNGNTSSINLQQINGLKVFTTSGGNNGVLIKFEFSYSLNDKDGEFTVYKTKRAIEGGTV